MTPEPKLTLFEVAAIVFIPVAVHFEFFELLNEIEPVTTADELTEAS
jgi:hypothetical protein